MPNPCPVPRHKEVWFAVAWAGIRPRDVWSLSWCACTTAWHQVTRPDYRLGAYSERVTGDSDSPLVKAPRPTCSAKLTGILVNISGIEDDETIAVNREGPLWSRDGRLKSWSKQHELHSR